jgi:hypothetical protein
MMIIKILIKYSHININTLNINNLKINNNLKNLNLYRKVDPNPI